MRPSVRIAVARLAVSCGAVALLAGCALRPAPAHAVDVAGVRLVDAQPLEQRFVVQVRLTNPTDRDVAVDGMSYRLDINGREFATGVSSQAFTVPRFGQTRVAARANWSLPGVLAQLDELRRRLAAPSGTAPALSYRLSGRANTAPFATTFDVQSELPFPL